MARTRPLLAHVLHNPMGNWHWDHFGISIANSTCSPVYLCAILFCRDSSACDWHPEFASPVKGKGKDYYIFLNIVAYYTHQCAQPALERVHHTVGGLQWLLQLIRVHSLIGQRAFDLLQPRGHLWVRLINIVLQIPCLERIVRMWGDLTTTLLICLQHKALSTATIERPLRIDALLIARLLRLALVHILLAVAPRKASRTAASLWRSAVATVVAARGANGWQNGKRRM